MAIPKIIGAQRDFSFGQTDVALKRADDHPARKAGLRQMSNARILNSGALQQRSGRRALYPVQNGGTRTERFAASSSAAFDIQFAPGRLKIINSAGTVVFNTTVQGNGGALPWNTATDISQIVFAALSTATTFAIYVTFGHAMRPQVITFNGVSTWSIADYTEQIAASGQKRTPFYRLSPQNVTMWPTAVTGAINVQFSAQIASPALVGTRMRYCNRQILLTGYVDPGTMNASVIEPLPPGVIIGLSVSRGNFAIGDVVEGLVSGAKGIVTGSPSAQQINTTGLVSPSLAVGQTVTGGTSGATGVVTTIDPNNNIYFTVSLNTSTAFVAGEVISNGTSSVTSLSVSPVQMVVQLLQNDSNNMPMFIPTAGSVAGEAIVGISGTGQVGTVTVTQPQPVGVWDDEVINSYRGFPGSVFVDQFRLGFCDFPAITGAIGWSAINSPTDLYVGADSANAMFEIAPDKVRILYVVPGPESSEFVFCDKRIYYIPITASNPLKPGSVSFQFLSGDGTAQVQPRSTREILLYANAGARSVFAIVAPGMTNRPFNTRALCDYHSQLFSGITAIAAPTADGTFNERYIYVMNANGGIVVGKYNPSAMLEEVPKVGWGPWSGVGTPSWVASLNADVVFTTSYGGSPIVEILDDSQYLDGAMPVNSPPAAFTALQPGGKGPLWWLAGQSVFLMDQGYRAMGIYQVDANGNIVPQFNAGEDLTLASLVSGEMWTGTIEPFVPDAPPGNSAHQRMFRRRVSRFKAYVSNSTGFLFARLFSGPLIPGGDALGTVENTRRVTTWRQGDNPTLPPPLREEAPDWRPRGRSYDARVALIKDTPGPMTLHEIGLEVTI